MEVKSSSERIGREMYSVNLDLNKTVCMLNIINTLETPERISHVLNEVFKYAQSHV